MQRLLALSQQLGEAKLIGFGKLVVAEIQESFKYDIELRIPRRQRHRSRSIEVTNLGKLCKVSRASPDARSRGSGPGRPRFEERGEQLAAQQLF